MILLNLINDDIIEKTTKNEEQDMDNNAHEILHQKGIAHSHSHSHSHDPESIRRIVNRLARAEGHLRSIKGMVERGEDCSEVLVQLAAVKSAINNTGKLILKEHVSHCIVDAIEENDTKAIDNLNDAIEKFIK